MLREYEKDIKHLLDRNKRLKRKNSDLKEHIFQLTLSSKQSKISKISNLTRSSKKKQQMDKRRKKSASKHRRRKSSGRGELSSTSMYENFNLDTDKLGNTDLSSVFKEKSSSSN
jgi:cell division septum initiation protein DivIVA